MNFSRLQTVCWHLARHQCGCFQWDTKQTVPDGCGHASAPGLPVKMGSTCGDGSTRPPLLILLPSIWQPGISHHDRMAYDRLQCYDEVAQRGWWWLLRNAATRCVESRRGTLAATTTSAEGTSRQACWHGPRTRRRHRRVALLPSTAWLEPTGQRGAGRPLGKTTQGLKPARENGNTMTALGWRTPPITVAPSATPIALSPAGEITPCGPLSVRRPGLVCQHGKIGDGRALQRLKLPSFKSKMIVVIGAGVMQ
jgi:hypothetical protein